MTSLSLAYASTGCNKSAQVVDWGTNDLICFGACNSIAVYDPTAGRILLTMVGHSSDVTCVGWIKGSENTLVSGSSDSTVIVWSFEKKQEVYVQSSSILQGHESSIIAVKGTNELGNGTVLVSSGSDNTVRIWRSEHETRDFLCEQIINTGSCFVLCLNMIKIPNSNILLGYGTDTPELVLYTIGKMECDTKLLAKTAGHEDWIRCIDMIVLDNEDILIATSSQDMMIRISRITKKTIEPSDNSFNLKKDEIILDSLSYYLSLESVLYGHEGWVYSVSWSLSDDSSPCLLSASFDRTLVIWKPCPTSGVWLEESRMGGLGGDQSLGYYGAQFCPSGLHVLAYSFQSSFHLWKKYNSKWVMEYVIGGHSDTVTDISWERNGRYLLSVSSDKSTRLHSPCLKGTHLHTSPWCELSRPQIHGHSLHGLATLQNLGFASCSEEKVVRVFMPSFSVVKHLNYFCDSLFEKEKETSKSFLPSSASVTALGLSNKANFENGDTKVGDIVFDADKAIDDNITPNEDYLMQNTLWPEVMKLYGHGNDVYAIAASNAGNVLATASKATSPDQAKIILWDTETWNIITRLDGHQLTVTQMEFSPDDTYLLSVSRDRKWCLFKKNDENNSYLLHSTSQKGKIMHSRIIWSCAWSHDGLYFATGSRDCKIIIWDNDNPLSQMTSDNGSVTALDFGPTLIENSKYILAVGHESGNIQIYGWCQEFSLLYTVTQEFSHHLTVRRLQFRPITEKTNAETNIKELQLASCSDDRSVRVYDIHLGNSIS